MLSLTILSALLLDRLLGEPKRFHPLVGFGNLAVWVEQQCNILKRPTLCMIAGTLSVIMMVAPFTLVTAYLSLIDGLSFIVNVAVLYWAIGYKSLCEHIEQVQQSLLNNELAYARHDLKMIVSRNTQHLDETQITQATIETALENGNDAIYAVLFWFCMFGAPAVIVYRLINTLDAMWGYRTQRYDYFGRCAARTDDVLNYIPARLVALSYAIIGNTTTALQCWQQQAHLLASPNAGPVMTSGAGSLQVLLGGPAYYHGTLIKKPHFGVGSCPTIKDIKRALDLISHTLILWCFIITTVSLIIHAL